MKPYPVITISRQYGSGGRDIGLALAKKLGIPYYDNELITMAAKESGFAPELFKNADQNASNSLLFSLSMYGTATGTFNMPLGDQVFLIQSDIIKKVANEGPCIIIGRCADYILRDFPNSLSIFLHAQSQGSGRKGQQKARRLLHPFYRRKMGRGGKLPCYSRHRTSGA